MHEAFSIAAMLIALAIAGAPAEGGAKVCKMGLIAEFVTPC